MMDQEVAIVAFAQHHAWRENTRNEVEFLQPLVKQVLGEVGREPKDIGFVCSGSSDYLAGQAFAFVGALDAVGPWPPLTESHVEMDGAWALYEAWIRMQHGDIDSALVYGFSKSSPGDLPRVLAMQLDPYTMSPLWPDSVSLAGIQARALMESKGVTRDDLAAVAARSRRDAMANDHALVKGEFHVDDLLAEPAEFDPLSVHDCAPISDGAVAMVMMTKEAALEHTDNPVIITGMDHRIEQMQLGLRDLSTSTSTSLAGKAAGVGDGPIAVAELHAPFTSQELILRDALGLDDSTSINPSGGALTANPMMAAGLIRIGEAAARLAPGERGVAHATSGPALQQNLVCVMEREA